MAVVSLFDKVCRKKLKTAFTKRLSVPNRQMLKVQLPVGALLEIPANPARHRAARDWTGKSMIEFDIPLMHCRLATRPQPHSVVLR